MNSAKDIKVLATIKMQHVNVRIQRMLTIPRTG